MKQRQRRIRQSVRFMADRRVASLRLTVAAVVLLLAGCGVEFDSVAQLDGLRILAVQKSASYAQPGEEVEFRMLYHDTGIRKPGDTEGEPRDISLFWLSGCENPPGDLYALCIEAFRQILEEVDVDLTSSDLAEFEPEQVEALNVLLEPIGLSIGVEDTFRMTVSEDVLDARAQLASPGIPPYGLNIVFFAACAGELQLNFEGDEFPISCVDEDGELLPARDFVPGYASVFTWEGLSNRNPVIDGIEVEGEELPRDQYCVGTECELLTPDPDRQCADGSITVPRCEDEDDDSKCDKLEVEVLVDPDSVDRDDVVSDRQNDELEEVMWVNYHTDRGKWTFDVALVNEASSGLNPAPKSEYVASTVAGPAHIWAVVRDNRGGAEWVRFGICVED